MLLDSFNRRDVSVGLLVAGAGLAQAARAVPVNASQTAPDVPAEISHTRAGIHQDVAFTATAARVYHLLTDAEQFDKVVQASDGMNSAMRKSLGTKRTEIDARPGGAFALFGGYITGYSLELVPDKRLVQAWRAGSWEAGVFSIVRFALSERQGATTLAFDHIGFPDDAAAHLAHGWHVNYWKPMAKVLA
jgi:uncharacterized protein YndB with AHSA1/START domain